AHEPVTAVNATRIAASMTTTERIASSARGCVRTLTAAPIGDATSAETNTTAARGRSICAVAALPMSAASAAKSPMPSDVPIAIRARSEEHTSELQSRGHLVCRLLLEKKNKH